MNPVNGSAGTTADQDLLQGPPGPGDKAYNGRHPLATAGTAAAAVPIGNARCHARAGAAERSQSRPRLKNGALSAGSP